MNSWVSIDLVQQRDADTFNNNSILDQLFSNYFIIMSMLLQVVLLYHQGLQSQDACYGRNVVYSHILE